MKKRILLISIALCFLCGCQKMNPEKKAIEIVKNHYVMKKGAIPERSAEPIGKCVIEFNELVALMSNTNVKFHGWQAESIDTTNVIYDVFFMYEFGRSGVGGDSGTSRKAWFQCNIRTQEVTCRNDNAFYGSWIPVDEE